MTLQSTKLRRTVTTSRAIGQSCKKSMVGFITLSDSRRSKPAPSAWAFPIPVTRNLWVGRGGLLRQATSCSVRQGEVVMTRRVRPARVHHLSEPCNTYSRRLAMRDHAITSAIDEIEYQAHQTQRLIDIARRTAIDAPTSPYLEDLCVLLTALEHQAERLSAAFKPAHAAMGRASV